MINFSQINYLAVLAATMFSYVFLGIWYSAHYFVGRKWIELSGANPSQNLIYIIPVAFVSSFIMCIIFAAFLNGGAISNFTPIQDALIKCTIVTFGFIIPLLIIQNLFYLFGKGKWRLIIIDSVFYIVQFIIFSIVLTVMR